MSRSNSSMVSFCVVLLIANLICAYVALTTPMPAPWVGGINLLIALRLGWQIWRAT